MSDIIEYDPNLANVGAYFDNDENQIDDDPKNTGVIEGIGSYLANETFIGGIPATAVADEYAGFKSRGFKQNTWDTVTKDLDESYHYLLEDSKDDNQLIANASVVREMQNHDNKMNNMGLGQKIFTTLAGEILAPENYIAIGAITKANTGKRLSDWALKAVERGAIASTNSVIVDKIRQATQAELQNDEIISNALLAAPFGVALGQASDSVRSIFNKNIEQTVAKQKISILGTDNAITDMQFELQELQKIPKKKRTTAIKDQMEAIEIQLASAREIRKFEREKASFTLPKFDANDSAEVQATKIEQSRKFFDEYKNTQNVIVKAVDKIGGKKLASLTSYGEHIIDNKYSDEARMFGMLVFNKPSSYGTEVTTPRTVAVSKDKLRSEYDQGLIGLLQGTGGKIVNSVSTKFGRGGVRFANYSRYKKITGKEKMSHDQFQNDFDKRVLKSIHSPEKMDQFLYGDDVLDDMVKSVVDKFKASNARKSEDLAANFEDVKLEKNYVGVQLSEVNVRTIESKIGREALVKGLSDAYVKGGRESGEVISSAQADIIAEARINMLLDKQRNMNLNLATLTDDFDAFEEELKEILTKKGIKGDDLQKQIDDIKGEIKTEQSKKARSGRLKRKFNLDLTHRIDNEFEILDLFETGLEQYHNKTNHEISAAISMKEIAGIDSIADIKRIQNNYANEMYKKGATKKEVEREMFNFEANVNQVYGRPIVGKTGSSVETFSDFASGVAYVDSMGQTGHAQFMETSGIIAQEGILRFIEKNIDSGLSKMFKKIQNKELSGEELEFFAENVDNLKLDQRDSLIFKDQEFDVSKNYASKFAGKANRGLDALKHFVSVGSGQVHLTRLQNNMAISSTLNLVYRAAEKLEAGKTKKSAELNRTREIGITDEVLLSLKAQIDKHGKIKKGVFGNYVKDSGGSLWDNDGLVETMKDAVMKNTSNVVQRQLDGDLPTWIQMPEMRLLAQFQKFMVSAYNKKLIRELRQMDVQTLRSFVAFAPLAYLSLAGKAHMKYLLDGDEERYEQSIHPAQMIYGLIQYHPNLSGINIPINMAIDAMNNDVDTLFNIQEGIPTLQDSISNTPGIKTASSHLQAAATLGKEIGMAATNPIADYDNYHGFYGSRQSRSTIQRSMFNLFYIDSALKPWVEEGE